MPDFATSIDRLLTQVHHWDERRWRAAPRGGAATGRSGLGEGADTRSMLVRGLVQRLADLGAEAESRPSRPVPHLHDLVLRDQLRVVADDILTAGPPTDLLERAAGTVDETRQAL